MKLIFRTAQAVIDTDESSAQQVSDFMQMRLETFALEGKSEQELKDKINFYVNQLFDGFYKRGDFAE
jgi:hypothetical protein